MSLKNKKRKILNLKVEMRFFDKHLFIVILILITLGLAFLASSSSAVSINAYGNAYTIFLKQLIWTLIGFAIMIYIAFTDIEKIRERIPILILFTILLLTITLFMPTTQGAKRWIPLKVINIQASEIAKIVIILYLSHFIDKNYSKINRIKVFIKPLLIISLMLILIALEPDIGTPFIIFLTLMITFFISGMKIKYLMFPIVVAALLSTFDLYRHKYRIDRIKAFLDPWSDPEGTTFQILQSLAAIGSGWWFGKGPGNSVMKLRYLPESHTDFIFPIIAEETGFIGVSIITLLFLFFFVRSIIISKNCSSVFLTTLSFASSFTITLQAFFNIAMSAGLLPTKGLPLPFFSYGGSSIITTMIMAGFIFNASVRRRRI